MGQKINPKGFRIGSVYTWDSRWFAADKEYKKFVIEDTKIRKSLLAKLRPSGVVKIEIERSINKINVIIHVVRPGMVIGRGGQGLEELKKFIQRIVFNYQKRQIKKDKKTTKLDLHVEPVKNPYLSAYFVASQIADQLARRLSHKRVIRFTIEKIMTSGAKGVKIALSGRIAGAEISRRETYKKGSVPLSTIREDIDFAAIPSLTKSGYIGVKVWICKK